jgi:hypothetical protein
LTPEPMENLNDKAMLESVRIEILQQLQDLQGAPSVAMHEVPPLFDRQHGGGGNSSKFSSSNEDDMAKNDDDDMGDSGERHAKTKNGDGVRKEHEAELYDKVD